MKFLVATILGAFAMTSPANAQTRPAVEHYPSPPINGGPAPFSSAVRVGAIGRGPDGKPPEGIEAQTKATLDDIGATLKRAGLTHADLFHCTAFLSDMKNWPAFNKVYVTYFPDGRLPARSAFGVNGLALGALLELECQAYAGPR